MELFYRYYYILLMLSNDLKFFKNKRGGKENRIKFLKIYLFNVYRIIMMGIR